MATYTYNIAGPITIGAGESLSVASRANVTASNVTIDAGGFLLFNKSTIQLDCTYATIF